MTLLAKTDPPMETMGFGPLEITFDERVLRPRAWTVEQSRWASQLIVALPEGPVAELGAGAGQIGLLSVLDHDRSLVLVDRNEIACVYARRNAERAGLAARVSVRHVPIDDAFEPAERFSLILADPPWVPSSRVLEFPDDPKLAIDGGDDGLDLARRWVTVMSSRLRAGGAGLLQLGTSSQAAQITDWLGGQPELGLTARDMRSFEPRGVVVLLTRTPQDL